ncbi:hypothetical protein jhhlp_001851 [Lomentospora prolificans]|uniref:Uncharacterized protein n=1 Tax=Lomentospora prolificans TaxID=41688 RepID=A0A2N3NCF3_9PEZI|nr:hypothetical protein jhhlp_001851 [Lomentospora prolificans]
MAALDWSRLYASRCGLHILQRRLVRRAILLVIFLFVLVALLEYPTLLLGSTAPNYWSFIHADRPYSPESIDSGERKFVILLPADFSSPDLCKVVSSAIALGYPAPVIVNWRKDFHTDAQGIGPSQLGKISGTLNYLEWATSTNAPEPERLAGDDLVMMLDAHDVWLQLPPSVLLDRFFKSNAQANRRIFQEHGDVSQDLMEQKVIVSAQKGCMAPRDDVSNLHCNSVPESTLPANVYGFLTDSPLSRILRWKYTRPRYINSGSFIGPASDLKKYFQRVKQRMGEDIAALKPHQELGGDQGIFAEIFGEQETWRRKAQEEYSRNGRTLGEAEVRLRDEFEYHVGLDYAQELFYPTCYSERDGYFVSLNKAQELDTESGRLGVSPPRIEGVPRDIEKAKKPLATLGQGDRSSLGWGDIPLYVDFWTTAVPVAIHHNAWRDGLKARRKTWWDKTWYFPHLRELLASALESIGTAPLATLEARNGTLDVWPYTVGKRDAAAMLFVRASPDGEWGLEAASWNMVCKSSNATEEEISPWYDEVFRDGKGAF